MRLVNKNIPRPVIINKDDAHTIFLCGKQLRNGLNMKEQIKKIAQQAKMGGAGFDNGITYYVGTEETFERFADLLIKDVINQTKEANILHCCATSFGESVANCAKEKIVNHIKNYYNIKYTAEDTMIGVCQ